MQVSEATLKTYQQHAGMMHFLQVHQECMLRKLGIRVQTLLSPVGQALLACISFPHIWQLLRLVTPPIHRRHIPIPELQHLAL